MLRNIQSLLAGVTISALGSTVAAQGRVVVNSDDWTFSNPGFARAASADTFATNVASWFTNGTAGRFLVYSTNFGLSRTGWREGGCQAQGGQGEGRSEGVAHWC